MPDLRRRIVTFIFALLTGLYISLVSAQTIPIDKVIAVVNEDVIMASELQSRLQQTYNQITQQGQQPPPIQILKDQVLERLIVERLQLQLAERASIAISSDEINQAISSMAKSNNMSYNQFKEAIIQSGSDFDQFRKSIHNELIIQRLQTGAVNARISITDQDITNFLNSEEGRTMAGTTYHVAHIILNVNDDSDEENKAAIADLAGEIVNRARGEDEFSQLARQYSSSQNAAAGGDLGWRTKSELPTLYSGIIDELEQGGISDPIPDTKGYHIIKLIEKKGSKQYWVTQNRVRHILIKPSTIKTEEEAFEQARQIRRQIMEGEITFENAAKKYSEDFGSALKGGELGWTSPGQMVPAFESAVDSAELNQVTEPVLSQYGAHIIEVQEKREEDMTDVLLKNYVKNLLQQRRFEEQLPLWLKELRDEAYIDIKDINIQPSQ